MPYDDYNDCRGDFYDADLANQSIETQTQIIYYMKQMTFAQKAILKRITEKDEMELEFQDRSYDVHSEYDAYDDCHGDYYDN